MSNVMMRALMGSVAALALTATAMAAEPTPPAKPDYPSASCAEMMTPADRGGELHKAMNEFMRSERAPQAMANMMEMARRMGQGDAMLGMTRMMQMMGSMGDSDGRMPSGGARPGTMR